MCGIAALPYTMISIFKRISTTHTHLFQNTPGKYSFIACSVPVTRRYQEFRITLIRSLLWKMKTSISTSRTSEPYTTSIRRYLAVTQSTTTASTTPFATTTSVEKESSGLKLPEQFEGYEPIINSLVQIHFKNCEAEKSDDLAKQYNFDPVRAKYEASGIGKTSTAGLVFHSG